MFGEKTRLFPVAAIRGVSGDHLVIGQLRQVPCDVNDYVKVMRASYLNITRSTAVVGAGSAKDTAEHVIVSVDSVIVRKTQGCQPTLGSY